MPTGLRWIEKSVPLRAPRAVKGPRRAQLAWILDREGAGSIAAASKDEEWRDAVEVADLGDGDGPRYQLWAWPSGSGVLFRDGTTEVVADAVHHELRIADPDLRAALAAALEASPLAEPLRAAAPAPSAAVEAPRGLDPAAALRAMPDGPARRRAAEALVEELFGPPWRPYPKRDPADLTSAQRAALEALLALDATSDLHHHGLVEREDRLARYLGHATGPSDVRVAVGARTWPLWIAATHVGSGDLEPEPLLETFRALPAEVALAAWTELARGEVADLAEVHPRTMAEAGIPRTPGNVKHRTRLFGWLADAALALGAPGVAAAEAVLDDPPSRHRGHALFVGLLALARRAKAEKRALEPRLDPLVRELHGPRIGVWADPVRKEILKALPKDRAAAVSG